MFLGVLNLLGFFQICQKTTLLYYKHCDINLLNIHKILELNMILIM